MVALLVAASADAASFTVTSPADGGGSCPGPGCTLRQAIATAATGDTIFFSLPANSAITLTSGELSINKTLTIKGPGADVLTVGRSTANGTPAFRIFNIASGVVAISGLTIANGDAAGGGGIFNHGGTVDLSGCAISGNSAGDSSGGGIYNDCFACDAGIKATMTITSSTISGNNAGQGGGIASSFNSVMTIINSTISDNDAVDGGGLWNNVPVTIKSSTISDNRATHDGGGINDSASTATAANTIIALNTAPNGPDLKNKLTSQGFNIIGSDASASIVPANGDQINVTALQLNLGPLQDNGGPTATHALLSNSVAIERGASAFNSDQRGSARPVDSLVIDNVGDGSDIGAYEVSADVLPGCNTVNRVVGNNDDGGPGSLRAVIANVCAGSTITFAPNVLGSINLTSDKLVLDKSMIIRGPGANVLSVQRSSADDTPNFRIFETASASVTATIAGLTIANGRAPGDGGGGIRNNFGVLVVDNSVISANFAGNGGGIFTDFGTVTISNSTLMGNSVSNDTFGGSGGGMFSNGGVVTIVNSTVSGNSAIGPGGNSDSGGGIITNVGKLTLTHSTISGNSADFGGGIRNVNGGTVTSKNTIIALNTSASGPDVNGPLVSEGFNFIGNFTGSMISNARFSDQIGTPGPIDPLLDDQLRDNGGPTLTRALLPGSPAIDQGTSDGLTGRLTTDQRGAGFPRTYDPVTANVAGGDGTDIGAFELSVPATPIKSKCDAGKMQCVAKKQACLLAAHAKAEKKGVPVDGTALAKCRDKFDGGAKGFQKGCIGKLESKQAAQKADTICTVTGDLAVLEGKTDAFVDEVVSAIDPVFPAVQPPNTCNAGKKSCMAKRASCALRVELKAAKKGVVIDDAALQACNAAFDGGSKPEKGCVVKLERKQNPDKPKTLCSVPHADVGALEATVDAFVADLVREIRNTP